MLKPIVLLLVFGIMNIHNVYAEDDAVVTQEDSASEERKPDNDSTGEKTPEVLTPDTFDPTEKLSEDNPVAFPVDI